MPRPNHLSYVVAVTAGLGLIACTSLLGDYSVDANAGTPAETPGDSGTSGDSATSGDSGSSGTPACQGDTVDACGTSCTKCVAPTGGSVDCVKGACQPTCAGGQVACGGACTDTLSSSTHCGKCDHGCGAGKCDTGACQPYAVAPAFTAVNAIAMSPSGVVISADGNVTLCASPNGCTASTLTTIRAGVSNLNDVTVAGTDVYFNGNEGDYAVVYRCPVAGCPGTGPTVVETVVNDSIGRVVAGPTDVLWTRYQSYYGPYERRCALPGCSAVVDVRPVPTTGPYYNLATREQIVPSRTISVGAVSTLWATGGLYNSNKEQLRACKLASACPVPTEIDTAFAGVRALTYFNGQHYGAMSASGGNVVFSVSDATPGAPTTLVADAAGINDVAVDASGIYWVNGTTGKVLRCATATGCSGSGQTLATGQVGATRMALDASFVYWTTPTAVMKVAK